MTNSKETNSSKPTADSTGDEDSEIEFNVRSDSEDDADFPTITEEVGNLKSVTNSTRKSPIPVYNVTFSSASTVVSAVSMSIDVMTVSEHTKRPSSPQASMSIDIVSINTESTTVQLSTEQVAIIDDEDLPISAMKKVCNFTHSPSFLIELCVTGSNIFVAEG